MPAIGRFGRQLKSLIWRDSIADQVDAELDFHLEMLTRELTGRGMTPEAARAEAVRRFGDLPAVNTTCRTIALKTERDARRTEYLAELRQDAAHAMRQLQRAPGVTAVALLTLILAIGANTAIFSVVSAVLLRPLPYPSADRLTVLWTSVGEQERNLVSYPDLDEWRARNRTFVDVGVARTQSVNLTGIEQPDRLVGCFVTANTLRLLGARASLGRLFTDEETAEGTGRRVAVLSNAVWRSRFGADPHIVGRTLTLNGRPHEVIGVISAEYQDPFGPPEVWIPVTSAPNVNWLTRDNPAFWAVGLLRAGVTRDEAQHDLSSIAGRLAREYPASNAGVDATVLTLQEYLVGRVRPALLIVLGFVALVLLIGCANIANLQLARSMSRRREMSLRAALGAGRGRLVRQLLTESLVLSLIGGTAGILLARWAIDALVAAVPGGLPAFGEIGLDGHVLLFSAGITVMAGLLFGAMPAVYAARTDLNDSLQLRGADGARGGGDVRDTFVAVQLALCIVLLVGAGLLTRNLSRLQQEKLGFDPENLLTAEYRLPASKYQSDEQIAQFTAAALERIRAVPGIRSAALLGSVPLSGNWATTSYLPDGQSPPASGVPPTTQVNAVSDGFFTTMGLSFLQGRDFDLTDRAGSPPVAIVSEELARRAWPGGTALGKRLKIIGPPDVWATVVGLVGNVKQFTLNRDVAPQQFTTILTGSFALLALLLAAVGVYGVMSYAVAQRTREIGIRMALGASRSEVVRMVVGGGLKIIIVATVLGLAASYAAARLLQDQLFGVSATDVVTFVAVPLGLATVAALACYLPARRAARVDPLIALQSE